MNPVGHKGAERRKYPRYNTRVKVYFRFHYDLKTKIKFQLLDKVKDRYSSRKYSGLSRDVSAEGVGFSSDKKLKKRDILYLEVYLPRRKRPVCMTGEVRWLRRSPAARKYKYDSGVKLITVSGKPVAGSIYFDKRYRVFWSITLEKVFGSFRKLVHRIHKPLA